jgi:hypothetical protein
MSATKLNTTHQKRNPDALKLGIVAKGDNPDRKHRPSRIAWGSA